MEDRTMKARGTLSARLIGGAMLAAGLLSCMGGRVSAQGVVAAGAIAPRPPVVLVRDFELDAADVRSDPGLVPHPILGHPLGGGLLHRKSPCDSGDAGACARELRELVATTLVSDLTKAGLVARRVGTEEPLPPDGWLVRGVFTDVDTGNRLHRAVIGFGSGATQMQLVVSIDNVAAGTPQPLYRSDENASSGRMPGAAVLMNPVAMGARFVMSRDDMEKSARKLAAQVSADIARRAGVTSTK
jgi:hypothetical protein